MTTKIKASELKPNDFVSFEIPNVPGGYNYPIGKTLIGMVRDVIKHNISGIEHRFVNIITEQGVKGAYLALTNEVVKQVMSDSERDKLIVRMGVRNTPRTVHGQGSDPEMFVVDKDGTVIPAFKFLPDKKNIPVNNPFWDGFQAEFNIPGVSCLDQTVAYLRVGLQNLWKAAVKNKGELTINPVLAIPPHMLTNEKEEFVQFGCMPSKNVYEMKGIQADGKDVPYRFAGGHVHLQLDSQQKKNIPAYVKALDAILGVACVSLFGKIDDPIRRKYYGLAGEYRTPAHGVEYRTLSNAWMCDPTIVYMVFELARKVVTLVDRDLFKHWQYNESDVISCINECNIPLAMEILQQNEEMFKDILMSIGYQKEEIVTVMYNTFLAGVEVLIKDPNNLVGNWNLDDSTRDTTYHHRIAMIHSTNPNYKKVLNIKVE